MIYTVTLNPALDYVIQVDHFQTGKINRSNSESLYLGGKGINVSIILKELSVCSTALGFAAGYTGKVLTDGLERLGVITDFVNVCEGMTRINVKMKSDGETEINGCGPVVSQTEFDALLEKTKTLKNGDMIVLSGSIPKSLESDAYERILDSLQNGVEIVVDAEKDLLLKVLKYHPFLIKPNIVELSDIFGVNIDSDEEVVLYSGKLQERGARNVLVSMAGDGAILVDEDNGVHKISAAEGEVVNSSGAGDSMVAGFIAGYLQSGDLDFALKLGTAAGGATAFNSGLADSAQIEQVLKAMC